MSLPTTEKTWLFNVNIANAAGANVSECYQNWLFNLKSALVGFASRPWVVAGSCDGTVAAMDGVDRWITKSNLVWTPTQANPKGWIVLKQPYISTNFSVLLWLNSYPYGNNRTLYASACSDGYSGGTTTTAPVPNGTELILASPLSGSVGLDGSYFALQSSTTAVASTTHVLHANDGTATYVFGTRAGITETVWIFAKPSEAVSSWNTPFVATVVSAGVNTAKYAYRTDADHAWTIYNNVVRPLRFTSLFTSTNSIGEKYSGANEISGAWDLARSGLCGSPTTTPVGNLGRAGRLPDLFFGNSGRAEGTTYPADNSCQFMTFGNFVVRWNGSTPDINGGTITAVDGDCPDSLIVSDSYSAGVDYSVPSGGLEAPGDASTYGSGGGGGGGFTRNFIMRAYKTTAPTGYVYWDSPNQPDDSGGLAPVPANELTDIVVVSVPPLAPA